MSLLYFQKSEIKIKKSPLFYHFFKISLFYYFVNLILTTSGIFYQKKNDEIELLFHRFSHSYKYFSIAAQALSLPSFVSDEKTIKSSVGSKFSFFLIADSCLFH